MSYCRLCGTATSAMVCFDCLQAWKQCYEQALSLLPLMGDEVAKTSKKRKSGGGVGSPAPPEAVSLAALTAKSDLEKAIYRLYQQLGTDGPNSTRRGFHRLQECPKDPLALYDDFLGMEQAVQKCKSLVEPGEARQRVGTCDCGADVYARPSQPRAKCPACGGTRAVSVYASNMRARTLARVAGRRLTHGNSIRYLQLHFPTHNPETIKKWVTRNLKDQKDPEGLYPVSALDEFATQKLGQIKNAA